MGKKHALDYDDVVNSHNNSSSPLTKAQCHYSLKGTKCDLLFVMNLRMLFLFITQISPVWSSVSWKFSTKPH